MDLVENDQIEKAFGQIPFDKLGLGKAPVAGMIGRPHPGLAMFADRSPVGCPVFNRLAAVRTALRAQAGDGADPPLIVELGPLLADHPDFRAQGAGNFELVGNQQAHVLVVEIVTGTGRNGFFRLPDPFPDQMSRTLDQYPLGRFRIERGDGQTHDRLAGTHFADQKGPFFIFLVKGPGHRQNAAPDLGVKGRPEKIGKPRLLPVGPSRLRPWAGKRDSCS